MVNAVSPGLLVNVISPLCALMFEWAMADPRPVPFTLPDVTKGSKNRSWISSGMPGPSSEIINTRLLSAWWQEMLILPNLQHRLFVVLLLILNYIPRKRE